MAEEKREEMMCMKFGFDTTKEFDKIRSDIELNKYTLDGSNDEQDKYVKKFLDSFTDEENERAMSHKFDYLDEAIEWDDYRKNKKVTNSK